MVEVLEPLVPSHWACRELEFHLRVSLVLPAPEFLARECPVPVCQVPVCQVPECPVPECPVHLPSVWVPSELTVVVRPAHSERSLSLTKRELLPAQE